MPDIAPEAFERYAKVCRAFDAQPLKSGEPVSIPCFHNTTSRKSASVSVGEDGYPVFHCNGSCDDSDPAWAGRFRDWLIGRGVPVDTLRPTMRPGGPSATPTAALAGRADPPKPPTEQQVERWAVAAYTSGRLAELAESRGLAEDTLACAEVGWNDRHFVFPVRDVVSGRLVDFDVYRKPKGATKRLLCHRKNGKGGRLYVPGEMDTESPILFEEGQWDTLAADEHGFNVVGWTGGAGNTGSPADLETLRGCAITILFDCDEAGRKGALKWAGALAGVDCSVRIADLDPNRSDGYDVRAFLNEGGTAEQLRSILDSAQPWDHAAREAKIVERVEQLAVTEEAKKRHRELAHPPVVLPRRTLADLLNDPEREPVPHRVDELHKVGHNTTITAQYKTGKTTFFGNLARSLVDDKPFLDRFGILRPDGRVGWLNYELTEEDQTEWLEDMGIIHPDAVALLNLRGSKFTLASDAGRNELVRWCRDQEVEILLLDTYRRARKGFGDENSNTDTDEFTAALDEIKSTANVKDLWLTVHTGRGESERGRGATALDDWADNRWVLVKDNGVRYFRADDGRSSAVTEFSLDYDEATRVLAAGTGSRSTDRRPDRKEKKLSALRNKIVETLAAPETDRPIAMKPLFDLVKGSGFADYREQCFALRDEGRITMAKDGNSWRIDLSERQQETMGADGE